MTYTKYQIKMTDPITLSVVQSRIESIANEMGHVLRRTAYSPNIKERADFSCAIFDQYGRLLGQAEAIPVHLGSMPFVAKPIIELYQDFKEGDAIITNSPRAEFGGTHLPDITLLAPVFINKEFKYLVANRAHHADVGGMVPGSLPATSSEIFQEGMIIPPVRLYIQGQENSDVMNFLLENVRTPRERRGDLRAQYSSLQLGVRRLQELHQEYQDWDFEELQTELLKQSKRGTINKLSTLPQGEASFCDYLDEDGVTGQPVKICCTVTISRDSIKFDFEGSDEETNGNCNAPLSITTSACYYAVRLITGRDVPTNSGCFEPVHVIAPVNSVVNPSRNKATSSANVETSSRIVDVILGALSQLIPEIPVASQGTMNNLLLGGSSREGNWSLYETIAGGTGGGLMGAGTDAIHSHMTNTENTPIEAIEIAYPIRVRRYSIRKDSGGKGTYPGGEGLIREIELLDNATLTIISERRKYHPYGRGRRNSLGSVGKNEIIFPNSNENKINYNNHEMSFKNAESRVYIENAPPHTIIRIITPGGGGWSEGELVSDTP